MVNWLINFNQVQDYRQYVARRLNKQRSLTSNKITKLFIKKLPEEILDEEKKNSVYKEAESAVREQHKQALAKIERQKRIQEAKRWLNERVMYYIQDGKISIEEIKKDFYGKFIKWDKSFQISTYIKNENLLKHSNEFSQEEKDLLIEIAWNCWKDWLKLLSIYAKQSNVLAEKQIQKILAEVMKKIRSLEPKDIDRDKNWSIYYYAISDIKKEIDDVVDWWCGEYIEEFINNSDHVWFILLSLADWWIPPTEEQIQKIDRYKDYHNSIVKGLFKNGKFREAFLLNTKNTERRWNLRDIQWNYEKSNNTRITDDEFIKIIVENGCWWIVLADYFKLELSPDQEKIVIQEMIEQLSKELSDKTLERSSLMFPWYIWKNLNIWKIKISSEDKKLLSFQDLQLILSSQDSEDKKLLDILINEKDNNIRLTYLLEQWYVSAAIGLFQSLSFTKVNLLSDEIIKKLLTTIMDSNISPYTINSYTMERYWLATDISQHNAQHFKSLPYNIALFFTCVHALNYEQISKIKSIIDDIIMNNSFKGTFKADIWGYSFNVVSSSFLNTYLRPLIERRLISEKSVKKLRIDSYSWSNAVDFRLRESILFEEWNPVANPYPTNPAWKQLWGRLQNNSIDNKTKQVVVNNIKITTTTNYRGETIPALHVFWKTISFLTYHTKDDNICYEKDWRYYINKDQAQKIANVQGKKILNNIEIPAKYGYEYQAMVRWTYYLGHNDIISLLGEYAPYCKINYRFPDKTSTYQYGFDAKGEEFSPVVVYEQ